MIDVLVVLGADAATGEARQQQLLRDLDVGCRSDGGAGPGQHLVERLGLGHGAREAVEDDAGRGVLPGQAVIDHGHHDVIRHEGAGIHVLPDLLGQWRVALAHGPEELAGGNVGQAQGLGETLGLGALARAGGTHHHDDAASPPVASCRVGDSFRCHLMKPS